MVPGAAAAVGVQGSVPELLVAQVAGSIPFGDFRFAQVAAASSSQLIPIEISSSSNSASALLDVSENAIIISPHILQKTPLDSFDSLQTPHLEIGLTHDLLRYRSLVVSHTHNNTLFKDGTAHNVKRRNHL